MPPRARDGSVPTNLRVVVSMRIDEIRCDNTVGGVDGLFGAIANLADLDDSSGIHGDIGAARRGAGSVDHCSVFD